MSHLGPPSSSMGAGAPLGANANNEPVLSIRVACEGADCNALLEVPIPDAVRTAAPPSLVIKCAQCKRMLQVNLPSETYSTYDAQLKAQQQAALIRQRQQELATLQALQMQLQAQQTALLSNFPGGMNFSPNFPPMDNNFGGGMIGGGGGGGAAFSGLQQNQMQQVQQQQSQQMQQHPQLQQQYSGGGGGGGGGQSNLPMSPGTVAAYGSMNNLNNMQPTGSYHRNLHQIPSTSSLPQYNNNNNAMLPPAQQQQHQQPHYSQQPVYSHQPHYQQQAQGHPGQYQQQQPVNTPALPIMPLSTPAQMPSMPSAAAVLAEQHHQQQQHQQQQPQQQQQLYQNQIHQQQFTQNASVLPSMGPASGNMDNTTVGGGNGSAGNLNHQGDLQAQQAGGGGGGGSGLIQTALERPATAGTAASPTVAAPRVAEDSGDRGVKRSKSSPASPEEKKEKKPLGEYQNYMKDEYKRLKAENPDMDGKQAFAQAAQAVSHSEGGEEVQEGHAHTEENQHQIQKERNQEERKKLEGKEEFEAGMKIVDDNDNNTRISPQHAPQTGPSAAAIAFNTPVATNAVAEAEAAATAAIEAKRSIGGSQNQPLSPRTMLLLQSDTSLSEVLRRKLAGTAYSPSRGSGEVGDGGQQQQEVQDIEQEEAAAAGKKIEEATLTEPAQKHQDIQEGFREEGIKNKEELTQGVWKYSDRNNRKRILTEAELDEILGRSKKQATTDSPKPTETAGAKVPQESDAIVVVTTAGNEATLPSAEDNIEKEEKKQQTKEDLSWQELLLQQHGHPAPPVVLPPVPPLCSAPFLVQDDKKQEKKD